MINIKQSREHDETLCQLKLITNNNTEFIQDIMEVSKNSVNKEAKVLNDAVTSLLYGFSMTTTLEMLSK